MVQGCALQSFFAPQTDTKSLSKGDQETYNPKLSKLSGKNYIRGVITALNHEKNGQWNYVIEGIDTANGKLPYVNFNHKSVVGNEGDLVYASFDGNKLTEMLIVKPNYFKNGKIQQTAPEKKSVGAKSPGKRDKAHQVLGVPQEESVRF